MPATPQDLLTQLKFLFEKYSDEMRKSTQPFHLRKIISQIPDYKYHPEDSIIRESLMEHIGSLPMVATAFYPYIQDKNVDLGRSLTMLAIHDIGELITGDEMTFIKKSDSKNPERQAALQLLHHSYHDLYDEVETQSTPSAQFAKAIDKITPDIYEYLTPAHITIQRYKHFVGIDAHEIIPLIEEFKRPYMLWSPFMTEFHTLLLNRLEAKLKQG